MRFDIKVLATSYIESLEEELSEIRHKDWVQSRWFYITHRAKKTFGG